MPLRTTRQTKQLNELDHSDRELVLRLEARAHFPTGHHHFGDCLPACLSVPVMRSNLLTFSHAQYVERLFSRYHTLRRAVT